MLSKIRQSRFSKMLSGMLSLTFIGVNLTPMPVFALTSGPAQPETQQFAPAGMDNMVDPFTGDFSYNIPLMDVGGYPINLNYAAGITPDQEASWVGLGWNLNVGAINRSVRGLPDDFAGDEVIKEYNTKPNETVGVNGYIQPEAWGVEVLKLFNVKLSASIFYNSYNGYGMTVGMNPSLSTSLGSKTNMTANLGLNLSVGSEDGVGITPSLGVKSKRENSDIENTTSASLSFPFSSREGLKGMSLSASNSNTSINKESKTYRASNSMSGSAFLGFATPAYTPFVETNTYSVNASTDLAFAFVDNSFFEGDVGGSVFYNGQFLEETTRKTQAFGYLHSGMASTWPEDIRLMDFNREKDGGGFNKFTIAMPLANHTYDIFNVSGQGVGGTYRAYRGDIGTVSDISAKDRSYSPEGGVELSFGSLPQPTVKIGFHGKCNISTGETGNWQNGGTPIPYASENQINTIKEPIYFKKIGEMSPESDKAYIDQSLYGDAMLSAEVFDATGGWLSNKFWLNNNTSTSSRPLRNSRNDRARMNTRFTALTASELNDDKANTDNYFIRSHKEFVNKAANTTPPSNPPIVSVTRAERKLDYPLSENPIKRVGGKRKGHHLSEIRVTDNSGARYVYGIPVYNNFQEEVTLALDHKGKSTSFLNDCRKTALAPYNPDDASTGNKNGLDHYYSKTRTDASASSFLLTEILSSDYVDSDNVLGPSDGDLGNYTKFNYTKTSNDFRWRTPFQHRMVSYNDGKYGTTNDDKGSYVYGEKEVWYLHSIETRTHVAEFYLENRLDGFGVAGSAGGLGNDADKTLKCLKKIVLYSKQDKLNGKSEALKTVHFDYDYSLCPQTPNSIAPNKGKLTLKKVWFTYGNSNKGVLNPYVFKYAEDFHPINAEHPAPVNLNPDYNIKNYDKWGNYKAETGIGNEVYPYVEQNKLNSDLNAAVYALSTIQTPTGGSMQIHYESDDYGYVQNQQAMEMYHVEGLSGTNPSSANGSFNNILYDGTSKDYLIIKLNNKFVPGTSNTTDAAINAEFREKYINGIDLMYFKMKVRVFSRLGLSERFEFVPGYAKIDKSLCRPLKNASNDYTHAVIKLTAVSANPKNNNGPQVNWITRTALSYVKLYLNREAFNSGNAEDPGVMQVAGSMLSMTKQIASFITGFNTMMLAEGNCSAIDPDYSYVRLQSPKKIKLGGGHRVKAIVMADNWDLMKSNKEKTTPSTLQKEAAYYGQFYDYTFKEKTGTLDVEGKPVYDTISSGVAAYEPQLGGDENPFRKPLYIEEKALLAPSREYYLEEPFGESFFPGASVGYKKVRTVPMKVTHADLLARTFKGNGTGYVEQEFYTAQDFPTIVKKTDITTPRYVSPLKVDFLVSLSNERVTTTQGYYIETNDMHGKEKSKKVMPDPKLVDGKLVDTEPISYVEYKYKTNGNGKLVNKVPYVNKDLTIKNDGGEMGVDIDVTMDQKFSSHTVKGGGAEVNPKVTAPALPAPIVIGAVTIMPNWADNYSEFKYLITTKVVNRCGILDQTIAKDNGQTITTQNLAWDQETGQVLLTKVENEFHDKIWNFTYPGHWAYKEMGLAYQNEGIKLNSFAQLGSLSTLLQDGDEFMVKIGPDLKHAYVNKTSTGAVQLMDQKGTLITVFNSATLMRSGHRNVAETPVGSIACLDDPLINGTSLTFNRVLNAGATQFKHVWKRFCNCTDPVVSTNPYVLGQKTVIRPWRSWTYLTGRVLTKENNTPDVRKDGYYANYKQFWNYNTVTARLDTAEIIDKETTQWQYVTQIENYNPVGMEIENKDALGRYSMAQFGYGRNLPVGTSNNSRYQESGYDGFEDYDYGDCKDDHFSWRGQSGNVTDREAHTGRKSINVKPGKKLVINKIVNPCQNTTNTGSTN